MPQIVDADWATSWLMRSVVARFVPALLVWPVWAYVMVTEQLFEQTFTRFWPMTVAMVFGSLIAGSTPLGGGAVAFPVTVLFVGFTPLQGRDYTVMIQAVGMPAASYVLIFQRREQLHLPLILTFIVVGTPGALFGLWLNLRPYYVNVAYTVLVLEFAIVLFYSKALAPPSKLESGSMSPAGEPHLVARRIGAFVLAAPTAFLGGFLTASVGMGSDIMLYSFGLYAWNLLIPDCARTDVSHTASSVVVMAVLSIVTAAVRACTTGMDAPVHECWAATAWLVVLGAPLGSLLLTPTRAACLRGLFYLLAVDHGVSPVQLWLIL